MRQEGARDPLKNVQVRLHGVARSCAQHAEPALSQLVREALERQPQVALHHHLDDARPVGSKDKVGQTRAVRGNHEQGGAEQRHGAIERGKRVVGVEDVVEFELGR